MRLGRGALVVALALGACRPREATEADAGSTGVPARPGSMALPACEVLLPADLRDLTLNGFTAKEERACPTCGPLCTYRSAAEPDVTVSIAYDCQERYASADLHALLEPTLRAGGEEVPALGRAAASRAPVQGMTQVVAWDDDTPCAVVVTWLGGDAERAFDVTRLALQAHSAPATEGALVPDAGDRPTVAPGALEDSLAGPPIDPLDSLTSPPGRLGDTLSAPTGTAARPAPATPAPPSMSPRPAAPATGGTRAPVPPPRATAPTTGATGAAPPPPPRATVPTTGATSPGTPSPGTQPSPPAPVPGTTAPRPTPAPAAQPAGTDADSRLAPPTEAAPRVNPRAPNPGTPAGVAPTPGTDTGAATTPSSGTTTPPTTSAPEAASTSPAPASATPKPAAPASSPSPSATDAGSP